MIKLFIAVLLLLSQNISAQDESYKQDILKVIEYNGAEVQVKLAKNQILALIPKDKQEAFSKEFDKTIPALNDKLASLYKDVYTQEDIRLMLEFYESPTGKKIRSNTENIVMKSLATTQIWSKQLQDMVLKYSQD